MIGHEIKKPTLFISHATSDAPFANAVQREIEKVFANGIVVFCTSSPGAIAGGTDWLSGVEQHLEVAQVVIAIVTSVSIDRPWLWFEIGATWLKNRSGDCKIYPLCSPEIELSKLPSPLDRLQALSMGNDSDLRLLFEALVEQFGFGNLSTFRPIDISKQIPKQGEMKLDERDQIEMPLYSGKYEGYADEELMEVLDFSFLRPDEHAYSDYVLHSSEYREYARFEGDGYVHSGKPVHFREVDRQLELPPGTAKRLLALVAARYGLEPIMAGENVIRFGQIDIPF